MLTSTPGDAAHAPQSGLDRRPAVEALHRARSDATILRWCSTGAGDGGLLRRRGSGRQCLSSSTTRRRQRLCEPAAHARSLDGASSRASTALHGQAAWAFSRSADLALAAPHAVFGLRRRRSGCSRCRCSPCCGAAAAALSHAVVPDGDPIDAETAREIRPDPRGGERPRRCARATAVAPAVELRPRAAARTVCDEGHATMSFEEAIAFGEGQIGLLALTQTRARIAHSGQEETAMDRQGNRTHRQDRAHRRRLGILGRQQPRARATGALGRHRLPGVRLSRRVTMSILDGARIKRPRKATHRLRHRGVRSVRNRPSSRAIRIVSNAGGVNPKGAPRRCRHWPTSSACRCGSRSSRRRCAPLAAAMRDAARWRFQRRTDAGTW